MERGLSLERNDVVSVRRDEQLEVRVVDDTPTRTLPITEVAHCSCRNGATDVTVSGKFAARTGRDEEALAQDIESHEVTVLLDHPCQTLGTFCDELVERDGRSRWAGHGIQSV
jgi:hypothetical protein